MSTKLKTFVSTDKISTEEQKEKSCIIEDIVKFAVSKGMKSPNMFQLDKMCDSSIVELEQMLEELPKLWLVMQRQIAFMDTLSKFMECNRQDDETPLDL